MIKRCFKGVVGQLYKWLILAKKMSFYLDKRPFFCYIINYRSFLSTIQMEVIMTKFSSIRLLVLTVLAIFGLVGCGYYPTEYGGPSYRPTSGMVVRVYPATLDTYSVPVLTCQYRSNQFSGSRDCGLSFVGGDSFTGFIYSAPQAQLPESVEISAMVSVNYATPVDGMCRQPRFLDADVSYVSGAVENVAQNEGSPDSSCEVRYSGF